MEQTFLEQLNNDQFEFVPYLNGNGVEIVIGDQSFHIFPNAIKALPKEDKQYANVKRIIVHDLTNPKEIEDNSLDYIVVVTETPVLLEPFTRKLKDNGHLCLFTSLGAQTFDKNLQLTTDNPPDKRVFIVRYGAIGDLFQIIPVIKKYKEQGYYTIVQAQLPSSEVLRNNPYVDKLIETERNIVRNSSLRQYWQWLEQKHPKFINLCGIVEDTLLPSKDSPRFYFNVDERSRLTDYNYVEFTCNVANLGYVPKDINAIKFYPTQEELEWAAAERATMPEPNLICYSLSGSSIHKVWPWFDSLVARAMLATENKKQLGIVTLGGEREQFLEGGWQEEPRVHKRAGKWTIRQTLTFVQQYATLLIGPETGIMNAMCSEPMPKIIFLSHSTQKNLTRDWVNTKSLEPPPDICNRRNCCLHRLHMWDDGFKYLTQDEQTGVTVCQSKIDLDTVWTIVEQELKGKCNG